MPRYIDADALYANCKSRLKEAFESEDGEAYITAYNMMVDLENAPTIEARPVVRGEWKVNTDDFTPAYRCSACGYNKPMIAGERASQGAMNFCSNCGAEMRGTEDG